MPYVTPVVGRVMRPVICCDRRPARGGSRSGVPSRVPDERSLSGPASARSGRRVPRPRASRSAWLDVGAEPRTGRIAVNACPAARVSGVSPALSPVALAPSVSALSRGPALLRLSSRL
jgi:hypothetical protein